MLERKLALKKAREDYAALLEETPELKAATRFSQAERLLELDPRWKVIIAAVPLSACTLPSSPLSKALMLGAASQLKLTAWLFCWLITFWVFAQGVRCSVGLLFTDLLLGRHIPSVAQSSQQAPSLSRRQQLCVAQVLLGPRRLMLNWRGAKVQSSGETAMLRRRRPAGSA